MKEFSSIIAAVAEDGFKPKLLGSGIELHGKIKVGGKNVPLYLRFTDLSLTEGPQLFLPDVSMLDRGVIPHVNEKGELCAVDRQLFVFDRYNAPEQTRGLIARATEILIEGMTSAATQQIADEFVSYWSEKSLNISSQYENPDVIGREALVTTSKTVSFTADQVRPNTLGELVEWADYWDPGLGEKIRGALAKIDANDPYIVIHAANASLAARVLVSKQGYKFQNSLSRSTAWKNFVTKPMADFFKIERLQAKRFDLSTLFGGNGIEGTAPLTGQRIVLIGCGSIGGYLARLLAQLGAGLNGKLTLLDPELLSFSNVRRHQLGLGDVLKEKAVACADAICRDFPGLNVNGVTVDVTKQLSLLTDSDIVIDATGEEGLSEWLNRWALDRRKAGETVPSMLFVWIAGHGAAAQSFLIIDDKFACYRCLHPDKNNIPRFNPLREVPPEPVAACGEQPTTPYGPAAPTAAASLAAQHVNDWVNRAPHALLRTMRIDWKATIKRDPASPNRAKNCPACGGNQNQ